MFENSPAIEKLYNQVKEVNSLIDIASKTTNKSCIFTAITALISIFLIITNLKANAITLTLVFSLLFLILFACISTDYKYKRNAYNFLVLPKNKKQIIQKEQEIIDLISEENTQKEIINFKNFNSVELEVIRQLKKELALKNFSNAYSILSNILGDLEEVIEYEKEKSETDKLIKNYELNLKMKL